MISHTVGIVKFAIFQASLACEYCFGIVECVDDRHSFRSKDWRKSDLASEIRKYIHKLVRKLVQKSCSNICNAPRAFVTEHKTRFFQSMRAMCVLCTFHFQSSSGFAISPLNRRVHFTYRDTFPFVVLLMDQFCNAYSYSWIRPPVDAREKSIYH